MSTEVKESSSSTAPSVMVSKPASWISSPLSSTGISSQTSSDIVGIWEVPLNGRLYRIEFEHGTTTGKRVVRIDGVELVRKDWQFKLVGRESFTLPDGKTRCDIYIQASNGFAYEYTLVVDGKSLKTFKEQQSKVTKTWTFHDSRTGRDVRVVLDKESLAVWVNGERVETEASFCDDEVGSAITFSLYPSNNLSKEQGEEQGQDSNHYASIRTISSGNKREGIVYVLLVGSQEIPEANELS